jgi:hypothetical protein
MIRIDILSQGPEEAVMRVAGWILGDQDLALVQLEGERCLQTSRRLVLDFEHLHALSDLALPILEKWRSEGTMEICTWPAEIRFKLRDHRLIPNAGGRD